MAAPNGNWDINANSSLGELFIQSVDPQGNLVGSTVFGQPILGFWDEGSMKLTFMRIINQNDPSTYQIYTGYYMDPQTPGELPALAGSFEAFGGTGGIAQRVVFGWYAGVHAE
jgi:hypothetical protein